MSYPPPAQSYPPPAQGYPPQSYPPPAYVAPPPASYPVKDGYGYPQQQPPVQTKNRGDGCLKGWYVMLIFFPYFGISRPSFFNGPIEGPDQRILIRLTIKILINIDMVISNDEYSSF